MTRQQRAAKETDGPVAGRRQKHNRVTAWRLWLHDAQHRLDGHNANVALKYAQMSRSRQRSGAVRGQGASAQTPGVQGLRLR